MGRGPITLADVADETEDTVPDRTVVVWVDCPVCRNANRDARWLCDGPCGGLGIVQKHTLDDGLTDTCVECGMTNGNCTGDCLYAN